ncbi:M28 family peptidase [Aliiglaciecola sp. LCG003]|uniref:M28 family peptidase n=1 Tax=Aliiglaciecola sp. LCG003 TaxID=3053655 RepID=UPI0025728126|nr:M28 family peptidase [Aliiglaciecola sp. LCG003]WJG08813.1 M28 family peptidase [Aliiglaciecola sp. LCG003]
MIKTFNLTPYLCAAFLCLYVDVSKADPICSQYKLNQRVNAEQLWSDFSTLASDKMQGRKSQTKGALLAREYIQQRYANAGLAGVISELDYLLPFTYKHGWTEFDGVNVAGWVKGAVFPDQYIVVTAHYDHLGKKGRDIYNGADDNASGVSAMLALADKKMSEQPKHSIIFLATDAEEKGLYGAKGFLQKPPVSLSKIKYNLNLDMLSQNKSDNRLYISGARSYPQLAPLVQEAISSAGLCLVSEHRNQRRNSAGFKRTNWRKASDHGAFAKLGIANLFIGVLDHPYYHSSNDTVDKVDAKFFTTAVETSLHVLELLDNL